jgi:hypothetical protein
LEVLSVLVDAYLQVAGRDTALAFLRCVAASAADTNVVSLREGSAGARAHGQARAWLRRSVTVWLAKHG